MQQLAIEGLAEMTYRRAKIGDDVPVSPMQLALALWSDPDAVQVVPPKALTRTPAALARIKGRRRIYVRSDCLPQHFRFYVGHELAHAVFADEGIGFATNYEEERACDALAGAFVAPRRAFRAAVTWLGADMPEIALRFGTTESLCLLRVGEVTGRPMALVRPGMVRTRGEGAMPAEPTLIELASHRRPRGWDRLARVDGERQRVALMQRAA